MVEKITKAVHFSGQLMPVQIQFDGSEWLVEVAFRASLPAGEPFGSYIAELTSYAEGLKDCRIDYNEPSEFDSASLILTGWRKMEDDELAELKEKHL